MAKSNFRIGDDIVNDMKLGTKDTISYLGDKKMYPLAKSLDDAVVTCASATYNGSNQTAQSITVTLSGVTLTQGTDYTVISNTGGTNAGNYTVTVEGINDYEHTASGTFTINKVTPTVTAPTAKSLTYNGSAQALANVGSTNYGTLQYCSTESGTYSVSMISGTNAGNYDVWYRVIGDSNVNDVGPAKISVTIAKADPAYTAPTAKSLTYNTSAQELLNAGSTSDGTIQYSDDNISWGTTIPKGTNANTYTSYWKIIGDSNHNDKPFVSISTTISPKTVNNPAITLSPSSYTYNANACEPTPTVKDGTVTIASSEYTVSYSNNTNVGTATCTITDKSGGNYTVSGSKTFTIICYSATAPTAKSLTYNTSAQTLANAGTTAYGTMVYCSTSGGTFSTTIPSGTNAGSYEVWWKVSGNTNVCNTAATKVACSIAKAAMTYSAPKAAVRTYNGSAQQIVSGQSAGGGSIQYCSTSGGTYTTTVPTQTNAGTSYSTWWKAVPDSNHSGGTNPAQITECKINQAATCGTAPTAKSLTYNGSGQALVNAGSSSCGTMQYATAATGTYSTTIPSQTNAGTYTTYWKVANDSNHSGTSSGSVSTTIAKAAMTYSAPKAAVRTYNGSAQQIVSGQSAGGGSIYYATSSAGASSSTTVPTQTNAGTSYSTYWKAVPDSNHSGGTSSWAQVTGCTINKANQNAPTATGATVTYHNTATATASGGGGQGTLTWTNGSTRTATGTTATAAYWAGNSNYNASPNSNSVNLVVNKATDQSITVTTTNRTYNGSGQVVASATAHGISSYYLGFGSSSTSAPSSWGSANSSISQTNAGTYYIWYKGTADGNHSADIGNTYKGTVTIGKADQAAPTATGATTTYNTTATATASGGGGQGTLTWTNGNTQTSVGSKKTKAYWAGNGNYNASPQSNEVTITMNKANQNAPTATVTTATYPGTSTASASGGGGQGTLTWTNGSSRTAIGTQDTYAYWAGNGNYNASPNSNKVTLSVAKFTPTVTLAATNRAYNGNALYATASVATPSGGVATKGTIYYGTSAGATTYSVTYGGSGSVNLSSVSVTNVGSATVYAYFVPDSSCNSYYNNSGNASKTFTVSKANQSAPTATGATTTFHNTATATASGGGGQGTLTWTNGNTRTATGSQDTYAYWAGNSNYNASPNSNKVTLTVNKATDQSVTVTLTNRTYNTSGQVVASATSHGCTFYLGFGSSSSSAPSSWGSANSSISQTNAGTYYVWYKGTADGNHSADIGATYKGTVTIGKADQSAPTATGATTTYNTTATATASGGGGQGSIEWSNGNTQTSVGSKTTKARWSGNSNYNASPYSNEVTIKMNKASQSAPTATGSTVCYGNTATASASGGGGVGTLTWTNGSSRTAIGSQTTAAYWGGNGNYNASSNSNSVTIAVENKWCSGTIWKSTLTWP